MTMINMSKANDIKILNSKCHDNVFRQIGRTAKK